MYRLDTCWCSRAYRRPAALLRIDIGTLEDELIRYSASIRSMYYLAVCIIASLVLSAHSSAQEFAAEPAIARAAVVLKLAFGIESVSPDDPLGGSRDLGRGWRRDGG